MGDYEATTRGKGRLAGVMVLGTVVSGALVAGTLSGLAPANASCINISGIAIGGGGASGACQASFGSFAIVLGTTDADAGIHRLTATAGTLGAFSPLNFAIAVGGSEINGSRAQAGNIALPGDIPSIGNVSFATGGAYTNAWGLLNLASSVGRDNQSGASALGVANSALNLGDLNTVVATGIVNNATNLFGDNNTVLSGNVPEGAGLAALIPGLNVGFNILGNRNTVLSGNYGQQGNPDFAGQQGPLAITGAIGVDDQGGGSPLSPLAVANSNFGVTLRTPFNVLEPTSAVNVNKSGATKLGVSKLGSGPKLGASLKKVRADVKSFRASVKKALGGLKKN